MPAVTGLRAAIVEAVRNLLTEVPTSGESARVRANYLLYKAEVYELLSVVLDPCQSQLARDLATYARYEARTTSTEF